MSRIFLRLDDDDDTWTWTVWLDAGRRDGVLIGLGTTRDEAITDADRELRTKLEVLEKFKEGG